MYKQTNVEINRNKGKNNRIGIVEAGTFTGRMPNKPTTFQQATMATILVHIHKDRYHNIQHKHFIMCKIIHMQ